MKPTLELLTGQFTRLIGPEVIAKAEIARAAAKAATEAAARAAAEKAAAKPAATATPAAPGAERSPRPDGTVPAAIPPRVVPVSGGISPAPARTATTTTNPPPAPAAPGPAASARPAPAAAARPAGAAPTAPVLPPLPIQTVDHAAKGYDFDAIVAPDQVVEAARILDAQGFGLDAITGVDWIAQAEMEVVYDYFHPTESIRVVVRARVPRATPDLPTISTVFPGANWHERETHDFFAIRFTGHPNLKPFLLPEDADFHPLRKDYQP